MTVDVDIGNLAIGVATIVIVGVTFFVSRISVQATKRQRIAEFRVQWMEDLRRSAAHLYKLHYELALVKRDISRPPDNCDIDQLKERRRQLYLEVAAEKSYILTMIKQKSDDPTEARLEELLQQSVSRKHDEAKLHRREIRELIGTLLHNNWKRVRAEIEK